MCSEEVIRFFGRSVGLSVHACMHIDYDIELYYDNV